MYKGFLISQPIVVKLCMIQIGDNIIHNCIGIGGGGGAIEGEGRGMSGVWHVPPHKNSEKKYFFGSYHVKFKHFSGKYLKFGNFVNFLGKYHKISGILIFFFAQKSCKIRVFC